MSKDEKNTQQALALSAKAERAAAHLELLYQHNRAKTESWELDYQRFALPEDWAPTQRVWNYAKVVTMLSCPVCVSPSEFARECAGGIAA